MQEYVAEQPYKSSPFSHTMQFVIVGEEATQESMPFLVEIGATPILASRYFLLLNGARFAPQRFT